MWHWPINPSLTPEGTSIDLELVGEHEIVLLAVIASPCQCRCRRIGINQARQSIDFGHLSSRIYAPNIVSLLPGSASAIALTLATLATAELKLTPKVLGLRLRAHVYIGYPANRNNSAPKRIKTARPFNHPRLENR